MPKCEKCDKNVTKSRPGVECNKCDKVVHLTAECSGLNNKQRAALRANDNLEWMCEDCQQESPKRRSVIIPEDDEMDSNHSLPSVTAPIDVKKLLKDIYIEMEKAMKRELKELTNSLEFHTEKLDEVLESMEAIKTTVQDLKKKNIELTNKNNNLETRVGALEQRLQEIDQQNLAKTIEIANIPQDKQIEPTLIVNKIAEKLQVTNDVQNIKILSGKKDRPLTLQVTFKQDKTKDMWVEKSKSMRIMTADIIPEATLANDTIYIREALTPYNKTMLWTAKQQLRNEYKYIWCKRGVIRVKKDDASNPIILRSCDDVKKLSSI